MAGRGRTSGVELCHDHSAAQEGHKKNDRTAQAGKVIVTVISIRSSNHCELQAIPHEE